MGEISLAIGGMSVLITVIPFVIIAVVFLALARRGSRQTQAVQDWMETQGRILHADVQARRSRSGTGYSTSYYPLVVYEYEVGGRRYQSQQIRAGHQVGLGFAGMVQNQVAKYPIGATVPVYFNPNDPSQAVLDKSGSMATSIFSGVALFIIIMLLGTVIFMAGLSYVIYQIVENSVKIP